VIFFVPRQVSRSGARRGEFTISSGSAVTTGCNGCRAAILTKCLDCNAKCNTLFEKEKVPWADEQIRPPPKSPVP
jgi:hypothetical protein